MVYVQLVVLYYCIYIEKCAIKSILSNWKSADSSIYILIVHSTSLYISHPHIQFTLLPVVVTLTTFNCIADMLRGTLRIKLAINGKILGQ